MYNVVCSSPNKSRWGDSIWYPCWYRIPGIGYRYRTELLSHHHYIPNIQIFRRILGLCIPVGNSCLLFSYIYGKVLGLRTVAATYPSPQHYSKSQVENSLPILELEKKKKMPLLSSVYIELRYHCVSKMLNDHSIMRPQTWFA